ncbi:lantibiotic dehydratase (plasmid) [Streptomyces sp. BI20]|uniref:lantibiotic dehydratase n=1 Tax=Streptomyces sp. BI20 TaxID=3403460 RepID=UPI003C7799F8
MYSVADPVLLRTTARVPQAPPGGWPAPDADPADLSRWLRTVWAQDGDLREMVRALSGDLAASLDRLEGAPERVLDARQALRAVRALIRYGMRRGRPTPLGLAAGVAEGVVDGTVARVRVGEQHRAVVRADGLWLHQLADALEAVPELLARLSVVTNTAMSVRGPWVEVSWLPRAVALQETTVDRVLVEATGVVEQILEAARSGPSTVGDLAEIAVADGADPATAAAIVSDLVQARALITCLRPPSTEPDALGAVLAALDLAGAEDIPAVAGTVETLRDIQRRMAAHNGRPAHEGGPARADLARVMDSVTSTRAPLSVDLHLDAEVVLPERVRPDIARAAELMMRLGQDPVEPAHWRRWREAFVARWSTGCAVAVEEAVDPARGIGFPDGYLGARPLTPPAPTIRDRRLAALFQHAAATGKDEVDITEFAASLPEPVAPPAVDMTFELDAAGTVDVEEGRYTLRVIDAADVGKLTGGRFVPLLGRHPGGITDSLRQAPTHRPQALPVQLSYPALRPKASQIARTPLLTTYVLNVGDHLDPGRGDVLTPADVMIAADDEGLYLWVPKLRRRIEPRRMNPLQEFWHIPPLVRFLSELPVSGCGVFGFPFGDGLDFGSLLVHLPFLPGLRSGRVQLSPPRWNLIDAPLPGLDAPAEEFARALGRWRAELRIPRHVRASLWGLQLTLDLDEPAHQDILRHEIAGAPIPVILSPEPDPDAYGWTGGRRVEIAAHLHRTPTTPRRRAPAPPRPVLGARPIPPGDGLRPRLRIHGADLRNRDILDAWHQHATGLNTDTTVWTEPHPDHLDLCVRVDARRLVDPVRSALGALGHTLITSGLAGRLSHPTHHPHVGAWGRGDLLALAEDVAAASTHLAHQTPDTLRVSSAAVAVLALTVASHGGDGRRARAHLVSLPPLPGPRLPDHLRRAVLNAAPTTPPTQPPALQRLYDTAAVYRRALADAGGPAPLDALAHLVTTHLHRALPSNEDRILARRLARAAALARTHHQAPAKPAR